MVVRPAEKEEIGTMMKTRAERIGVERTRVERTKMGMTETTKLIRMVTKAENKRHVSDSLLRTRCVALRNISSGDSHQR